MNLFRIPALLYHRTFPSKTNDLSFGLIDKLMVKSQLSSENWDLFDESLIGLEPNELTRLLDGLCLTDRYDELIQKYIDSHNSEAKYLVAGAYYLHIAWKIRARDASTDEWRGFYEYLEHTEESLLKVDQSSHLRLEAMARLIRVYMGMGKKEEARENYTNCIDVQAEHFLANHNFFKVLTPKWQGSQEELKDFVDAQKGKQIYDLIYLMYHVEIFSDFRYAEGDDPESVRSAKSAFFANHDGLHHDYVKNIITYDDDSMVSIYTKNYLAYAYNILNMHTERNELLKQLKNRFTLYPWAYFGMRSERDVKLFKFGGML